MTAVRKVVARLGLFQVDSVNVFARAHEMPVFSRCGSYDPALLERAVTGPQPILHETWAHVASLVDVSLEPALRHRQASASREAWGSMLRIRAERPELIEEVISQLDQGPATARQISAGERGDHPESWGWNWSATKTALEWGWRSGRVAVAGRTASFEKIYDRPDRVLPPSVRAMPALPGPDAHRVLADRASRALGVFTVSDLVDYFRTRREPTEQALAELVADGLVVPVTVAGQPGWWMRAGAVVPRRINAAALVSPFDPLIFHRPRGRRLFGLDYRIEIYTPARKRVYGYYCLPFLLGQDLVARVDLAARRAAGRLEVAAAWREPGAETSPDFPGWPQVAGALAEQLEEAARWRGLDRIVVVGGGDLAAALSRALG
ncbi:winged helix-turn-helix domain-containing protein [Acidipropionibacterium jensenii]|uniref:winged helix-turn-helix domain-containing protein n=1 Tax=Acidipropionibacterium jensenii TaxID=1749 RepID=UPI00214BAB0F|nr:crosslink repair DNA glycosylase YcaQ family protein [Acidipropionibacterium jensenii]